MDFLDKLSPHNVAQLVTFFLLGFVFRSVERGLRNAPGEETATAAVMAVVWSLILSVLIQATLSPIPAWVPGRFRAPLSLASYLVFAALCGTAYAYAKPLFYNVGVRLRGRLRLHAKALDPVAHAQSRELAAHAFFLGFGKGDGVVVCLKTGQKFSGKLAYVDFDRSRMDSFHFTLTQPKERVQKDWVPMSRTHSMLLSMADVLYIRRIVPSEPAPPSPEAAPTGSAAPSSTGTP